MKCEVPYGQLSLRVVAINFITCSIHNHTILFVNCL